MADDDPAAPPRPGDDDRFGDLGEPRRPSAAERLAAGDEAELAAERRAEPPKRGPSSAYSWVVGIAFLIAISVGLLNVIQTEGPGALGPERGDRLRVFAAPLATGKLEGDANVKRSEREPGETLACDVKGPDVVNLCEARRKPVVLSFMFTRFADCAPHFDKLDRVAKDFPGVSFVGVIVREPKEEAARLVRRRGWDFPVAVDRDGAVSNLYGVGVCPTTVFARRGGRVTSTALGELSEAQIRARVRRLAG